MLLRNDIKEELKNLGLTNSNNVHVEEIQNKDGIYLFRIKHNNKYFILKYFLNEEHRREIENYNILNNLNIPTIKVLAKTKKSLLLEDLDKSEIYRLGKDKDLCDTEVAKIIARWYLKLHNEGAKYLKENKVSLYSEIDLITKENIELIRYKSNIPNNKVWNLILYNFDLIIGKIQKLEKTLTYNDFYWTNLAVKKDKTEAIMFDYNLLGTSFRYSDIRNVCSSLSPEAKEAFLKEYGEFNESEKLIDDGISTLFDLMMAYSKEEFPSWGKESLETIHSGRLEEIFKAILEKDS